MNEHSANRETRKTTVQRPSAKQPVARKASAARKSQATRKPASRKAKAGANGSPSGRTSARGPASRAGSRSGSGPARAKGASSARGSNSRSSSPQTARNRSSGQPASVTLADRITSSKPAMVLIAVAMAFFVVAVFDTVSNWGKAYGNVSVNGIDVGGMTSGEIQRTLKEEFGPRVSHAQVTIYASDEAMEAGDQPASEEDIAIAEQISAEEAAANVKSWQADSLSLKASVPYEEAVESALAVGRDNGGALTRLGLLVGKRDVAMRVDFGKEELESLAAGIDRTIGDPRQDTTVEIEDGTAYVVEGHDGVMVDRPWLKDMLSDAMLYESSPDSFVAQASVAHSRISSEQAQEAADAINRAIKPGAHFNYQGHEWLAEADLLGEWTDVDIVQEGDEAARLAAHINTTSAVPAVVSGADAVITSDDMVVSFENIDGETVVHTSGSGNIPEVTTAVNDLNQALYGEGGAAWNGSGENPVSIDINESDRPEALAFDDALELGVITVIGEYTTEFSTQEGTENRNHNIKLAADILNGGIVSANGGTWDFNERSGNTNEEAGFWEAGSIVDGEYVDSIGGGICQVATTVFNAAYEAGLDIVERHNHSLYIASYPTGRDAAVDYPNTTLIWRNDFPSDVLLRMSYADDTVTAKLYSVYTGYSVSTETGEWQEGEEYGTRYEVDDSIDPTDYYRKTTGADGSSITIVRTVKDADGKTVSVDEFESNYAAKDEIYVIGTKVDTSELKAKR